MDEKSEERLWVLSRIPQTKMAERTLQVEGTIQSKKADVERNE